MAKMTGQQSIKAHNTKSVTGPKNWTVMIFLAADSNLALEMVFALKEMCRVGTTPDFNVFVRYDADGQFIPFEIKANQTGKGLGKAGFHLPQSGLDFNLLSQLRKSSSVPAKTAATPPLKKPNGSRKKNPRLDRTLVDFVSKTILHQGLNRRYMLVLSGHGTGAVGDFLASDRPSSRLTIPRLGRVFRAVKKRIKKSDFKIDILGLDSCVMSMAEVVYEVQPYVKVMVGSEGTEPSTGWNYAAVLNRLHNKPTADEEELSRAIVRDYLTYYKDFALGDVSVDQSALSLSTANLEGLHAALRNLTTQLIGELNSKAVRKVRNAILLAHWDAQSYKFEQYTDLYDFCELLAKQAPKFKTNCKEVMKAIKNMTLLYGHAGAAFQRSHGLSVFFPWASIEDPDGTRDLDYYADLQFAKADHKFSTQPKQPSVTNGWREFLEKCIAATETPAIGKPSVCSRLNRRSVTLGGGKLGTPSNDRLGTPSNDRLGTPSNDRGSLASGITAKIGQMKNPPIQFDPDAKPLP